MQNKHKSFAKTLEKALTSEKIHLDFPLKNFTTLKIGGPADTFCVISSKKDLVTALKLAKENEVPITVLGGGSNVLIADEGIRGLVIKNATNGVGVQEKHLHGLIELPKVASSWIPVTGATTKDLEYDESDKPHIHVKMETGAILQKQIYELIDQGITGLHWFSGIPGTVGGALINNIHSGTHHFSDFIENVEIFEMKTGLIKELDLAELQMGYDKSYFRQSKDTALEITFRLFKGDTDRAKYTAEEWFKRKKFQPRNSPGCTFLNISNADKERLNIPTTSTGHVIEHLLKLTNLRIGDAGISPAHHNFIVNFGKATAKEYLKVIETIKEKAKKELGVDLQLEIIILGY